MTSLAAQSTNPHPNVEIEMLKRLLTSELKNVAKRNLIAERKFSEMLERAMRSYTNRSLDAAEIITELVELAKEMRKERDRGADLGCATTSSRSTTLSVRTTLPFSSSATTR